jgi:hypothetical protein
MDPRRRSIQMLTAIVVVAVVSALTGGGTAVAGQKPKSNDLLGSWTVSITEGPGTPDLPTWYRAHVTFTPGGGLVATITDANIKTGHGTWTQVGKRRFAITILLPQFDPGGSFVGTLKARATLQVNKKSQTFDSDDYRFELLDPDGNSTGFTGSGTAHGARIKVEP